MKRKILLFITLLAMSQLVFSQASINCFPASGDYNTGTTDGSSFLETSLIKSTAGYSAGWARFDISGIPEGATVQSVELHMYIYEDNNAYWYVMDIEDDPLDGTASSVYTDCTNGTQYASWTGADFPQPSWYVVDLGTSAVADLIAQQENGWFGISMWEFEGSYYAIACEGWEEDNAPYITVTYLQPGAPLPAYNPYPVHNAFAVDIDVDLTWDFGTDTDTYDMYFGTNFPPTTLVIDNEVPPGASGTYDPGIMEFQTTYYWQIVSKNADYETPGPIWAFTTACDAFEMSIYEDFNTTTAGEVPYCWSRIENSTSQWAVVETYQWDGMGNTYCLFMSNSDDPNAVLMLISPKLSGGAAGKYINFFAWGYAPLSIGTITEPSDPDTYTEAATVTLSNSYLNYQEFEVFFNNYTGDDEYIAIKLLSTDWYQNSYIENILIDFAPTCPKPTDLYSAGSTTTTATIGWNENGSATQWEIEYGEFGFTPDGVADVTTGNNPVGLTGLTPSTVYQFYVRAYCSEGDISYWVGPKTFQTQCETFDLPYFEGFESVDAPMLPPCNIVEDANEDNTTWHTYNDPYNAYQGNNYLQIEYTGLTMDDWFFSPPLNLVGGETYIVDFYYTANYYYYNEKLEVKWGTDAVSSAMTEGPIFVDEYINYDYDWQEGIGYFIPETDGVYYVGFHGYSLPWQYYMLLDAITIDLAPTCLKPNSSYTESVTQNEAIVGWTESAEATLWNIEYGLNGFTPGEGTMVVADSNPFELTELMSGTTYDFYVQADCGGGDVSWWDGPETFTTLCDPLDVPIFEDFGGVIPPELPDCWRTIVESTSNAYIETYQWSVYSSPNCLYYTNGNDPDATILLVSPSLSEEKGAAGKWVRFYAWGYAQELAVGTMTNPYDASTFTAVTTVELSADYLNYQEYEAYFNNYTGDDQFIAFKGIFTGNWQDVYIDDITIDHPPSCPKPSDLSGTDATTSTVMLQWQENGSTSTWDIEYGVSPYSPTGVPTISVTENPYLLTGLMSGTKYDFYVRADCGEGDLSEWSFMKSFTTLCEAMDPPEIENFDGASNNELPPCWIPLIESYSQWAQLQTVTWNYYSAPNSLYMYNSEDAFADIIAIAPMMVDPVEELWINFFGYSWSSTELIVGTITDPLDASTFTEIETVSINNTWQEFEVFFSGYTGTDEFIAFKGGFIGSYQEIYIDNVTIDHPPTCPKPKDLYSSDASQTSIMLGWQENGTATQWNIEYGYAGFTPTGIANAVASTNPFELTGLEDGTLYQFYVQADCGEGDQSYWVGPKGFQTLCYPTVLAAGDYFEEFEGLTPPVIPACIAIDNANDDDFTWQSSFNGPYSGISHMSINYNWNGLPMDDWFFSPPLELLGGQTYNVVFYYTSSATWGSEKLEVKWGDQPSAGAMTSEAIFVDPLVNYGPTNYQEAVTSFSPPENGVYFVGWHGYSSPWMYELYVDDIFIEWDNSLVVEATATMDSICNGGETQLLGSAVGGSGNYSYSWTSDPAGFTSNEADPVVSPTVTTDYILEVNDTFVSIFDTITIHVTQLPAMPGTPSGITFFCASWGSATYSTSGASGANWYDWSVEPAEAGVLTGTGTSVSIDWNEGWLGNAILKVTGMHDVCAGPTSNGLSIMVYLPTVTLPDFEMVCIFDPAFNLTGGAPAGGTYSGPGVEGGMFDPAVAGLGTHTITYTYSDAANCENFAEATIVVDICDGINEYGKLDLSVTPNPNDGIFTLKVKARSAEKVNIKVMNSFGEEVYYEPNVDLHSNYSKQIDLSAYSKGLYYLYIYSDDVNHVEKIIVK